MSYAEKEYAALYTRCSTVSSASAVTANSVSVMKTSSTTVGEHLALDSSSVSLKLVAKIRVIQVADGGGGGVIFLRF